jgi:riboflavin biosynthesis pyrimidine reductase
MTVLRLYPAPHQQIALSGLYLDLNLHRQAADGDILIYSNFITSLDGRISMHEPESGEYVVPESIANRRDWRLYQELAAQSDVMLTSARYFRQLAKGKAQDLLPVGTASEYADLLAWRREQGLKRQPDVMVVSNSLDIPVELIEKVQDRSVTVLTSQQADREKLELLQSCGVMVFMVGGKAVEGLALRKFLIGQGYRSVYMVAGPQVHRTLIADQVLDRMFLSTHFSLLGGDAFHTILEGDIEDVAKLELCALYLDQLASSTQLFACFKLMKP